MKNIEDEFYQKMLSSIESGLPVNNFLWSKMAKGIEGFINESIWHPVHQNIEETLSENLSFFDIFSEKTNSPPWQKKMQKELLKKW